MGNHCNFQMGCQPLFVTVRSTNFKTNMMGKGVTKKSSTIFSVISVINVICKMYFNAKNTLILKRLMMDIKRQPVTEDLEYSREKSIINGKANISWICHWQQTYIHKLVHAFASSNNLTRDYLKNTLFYLENVISLRRKVQELMRNPPKWVCNIQNRFEAIKLSWTTVGCGNELKIKWNGLVIFVFEKTIKVCIPLYTGKVGYCTKYLKGYARNDTDHLSNKFWVENSTNFILHDSQFWFSLI